MKEFQVHRVNSDGSSVWLATFCFRYNANDFVTLLKFNHPGNMFSITEVSK